MEDNRGLRKNFNRAGGVICTECFKRDRTIEELREKIAHLNARVAYLVKERKPKRRVSQKEVRAIIVAQGPHTPSSKINYKPNSDSVNQGKQGGAKPGHKGYGRVGVTDTMDCIEVEMPDKCPCCEVSLSKKDIRKRLVLDISEIKCKKQKIILKRGQCPKCRKTYEGKVNAPKKGLLGNRLISQAIILHYLRGIPLGQIPRIFGHDIKKSALINSFHKLSEKLAPTMEILKQDYRDANVRHADETGWRNNGCSGYAWLFATNRTTYFDLTDTRAATIPLSMFGVQRVGGYLVVDRYSGYNKVNVENIQYCYAHLQREIKKLPIEFQGDPEIEEFSKRMTILLRDAMTLRRRGLNPTAFANDASAIKSHILQQIHYPYKHLAIIRIQDIFRNASNRLYHWAKSPDIPAENNKAEREIRPLVIARKTSFGSQSKQGAKTRSIFMSVLYTAEKRLNKNSTIEDWLFEVLNKISNEPRANLLNLFPT